MTNRCQGCGQLEGAPRIAPRISFKTRKVKGLPPKRMRVEGLLIKLAEGYLGEHRRWLCQDCLEQARKINAKLAEGHLVIGPA